MPMVYVFAQNSPFDKAEFYGGSLSIGLPSPTNSTMKIANAAQWCLKKIYKPACITKKRCDANGLGARRWTATGYIRLLANQMKKTRLMQTMDTVNKKYARGTIKLGV